MIIRITKKRVVLIPFELAKELKEYSKNNETFLFESKIKPNKAITARTIEYRLNKLASKMTKKKILTNTPKT